MTTTTTEKPFIVSIVCDHADYKPKRQGIFSRIRAWVRHRKEQRKGMVEL